MPVPAAAETLAVWERGTAALFDAAGVADPALLPLGGRDAALLRLYAATFGDRIDGVARCPSCATTVELTLSCDDLLAGAAGAPVRPLELDGYAVSWRLPTAADLAALAGCGDAAAAGAALLGRCVTAAERAGTPVAPDALPDDVRDAVGAAMAAADPLAEILLDLGCPQCAHRWASPLDVAEFVRRRYEAAAHRLLREVHLLARAYGWTEPEVLALSPARRAAYLRLVAGG
jgi:hypothetical protein